MQNEIKLTFPALFHDSVKNYGQADFLSFVGETPLTYNQVSEKVDAVMALLEKQNVQKGDTVIMQTAYMLYATIKRFGNADDFLGGLSGQLNSQHYQRL